jgi:hypothetical protein
MKKLAISTAVFAALCVTSAAQAYQLELNGGAGYAHLEEDKSFNNVEAAAVGGSATYYLSPVDTAKGPLAQAAFTTQSSSITAAYAYAQGASELDGKAHVLGGSGEFYIPTKLLGLDNILPIKSLYAAGGVSRAKFESSNANDYQYNAEVGLLPVDNLLLSAGVVGNGNLGKDNDPNLSLRAKYLTAHMGSAVNLEGRIIFGDNRDKFYQVTSDYYFDRTLSVGAIARYVGLSGESDLYGMNLNARKFVTENISFLGGISYGNGLIGFGNDNVNNSVGMISGDSRDNVMGVNAGATLRF